MKYAAACIGSSCPNVWVNPSGDGSNPDNVKKIIKIVRDIMWGYESITFGLILHNINASLDDVYSETSQEDWDGYGASAITEDAYNEAKKLIYLLSSSIPMPEIVAEPTGGIGFEWRRRRGLIFVISVSGNHKIEYAGIFGENKVHGSEYFGEALPATIIDHLTRLYS